MLANFIFLQLVHHRGYFFENGSRFAFLPKESKKLSYIETKDNHVKIRYKKKNYSFVIEGSGENITLKKRHRIESGKHFHLKRKHLRTVKKTVHGYEMKYKKKVSGGLPISVGWEVLLSQCKRKMGFVYSRRNGTAIVDE